MSGLWSIRVSYETRIVRTTALGALSIRHSHIQLLSWLIKAIIHDLGPCMSHSCFHNSALVIVGAIIPLIHCLSPTIVRLHWSLIMIRKTIHSICHWVVSIEYPH